MDARICWCGYLKIENEIRVMKRIFPFLSLLTVISICSACNTPSLREAKSSLANSIETYGLHRYCDFTIDGNKDNGIGTIIIKGINDSTVNFEFGFLSDTSIPLFNDQKEWRISATNINLSGDFSKIVFDQKANIKAFKLDPFSELFSNTGRVSGWLYNKAITKSERPEYDIKGEIELSWDETGITHKISINNIHF